MPSSCLQSSSASLIVKAGGPGGDPSNSLPTKHSDHKRAVARVVNVCETLFCWLVFGINCGPSVRRPSVSAYSTVHCLGSFENVVYKIEMGAVLEGRWERSSEQ